MPIDATLWYNVTMQTYTATMVPFVGQIVECTSLKPEFIDKPLKVKKTNPKNAVCEDEHGQTWKIPYSLLKTSDRDFVSTVPPVVRPRLGSIITVNGTSPREVSFRKKYNFYALDEFVVIAHTSADRIKVVEVGGNDSEMWWTIPVGWATIKQGGPSRR